MTIKIEYPPDFMDELTAVRPGLVAKARQGEDIRYELIDQVTAEEGLATIANDEDHCLKLRLRYAEVKRVSALHTWCIALAEAARRAA